ncbi:EAL domain-containing protein [Synechococcus sp. RSCCF101]|uniref:EAL domain-containing protein n=1 Tax=Synechococcus sp. RSCCF101 TaxID=2511069 RepID=UPI00177CB0BE|nr:EAL domain-containing protein [Synechococcus sp. RSCCF101]
MPTARVRPEPRLSGFEIRDGLASDAIRVVFQPQVFSQGGGVRGAEAFLRWQDASGVTLPPSAVMEAVEKDRLWPSVTKAIMARTLKKLRSWLQKDLPVCIGIKLPGPVLIAPAVVDAIAEQVLQSSVKPSHIVFHIESLPADLSLIPAQQTTLGKLHDSGFRLSALCPLLMTDFTLSRLGYSLFDEFRIDFRLAHPSTRGDRLSHSTERFVAGVRKANKLSIVQNLETRADYDIAVNTGVDLLQGYFISKPLTAAEFEDWQDRPSWQP